jgi:DNA mismatch repair protein MSH6
MKQYWDVKSQMYDKVCLFKLGKFYEIFYGDAIICNKILDLAYMYEVKKLHVGFPEKLLDEYIDKLVS